MLIVLAEYSFMLSYVQMDLVILDHNSYALKIGLESIILVLFWFDTILQKYVKSFDIIGKKKCSSSTGGSSSIFSSPSTSSSSSTTPPMTPGPSSPSASFAAVPLSSFSSTSHARSFPPTYLFRHCLSSHGYSSFHSMVGSSMILFPVTFNQTGIIINVVFCVSAVISRSLWLLLWRSLASC